jgi:hypothetical protein
MTLYYNDREVTPDLYCLEWNEQVFKNTDPIPCCHFFTGPYAYQKAIIYAHEANITGKIVYCLSKQYQNIVDGIPVKRGVKKKNKRTDFKNNSFTPQLVTEPEHMKPI